MATLRDETRVLLLDIEGTTTPLKFVTDVLFPYARRQVAPFLRGGAPGVVRDAVAALRAEHAVEGTADPPPWDEDDGIGSALAYVRWLMDRDRKSTALKSLQGAIWAAGYRDGTLQGEIYPDVPPALQRWTRQGRRVAIFSSGSVEAQRDLFSHSRAGDLTGFLSGYFDTTTGPKREADSYRTIVRAMDVHPSEAAFLSDVVPELDAARAAGMQTLLAVRGGAEASGDHPVIHTFDGILA